MSWAHPVAEGATPSEPLSDNSDGLWVDIQGLLELARMVTQFSQNHSTEEAEYGSKISSAGENSDREKDVNPPTGMDKIFPGTAPDICDDPGGDIGQTTRRDETRGGTA
jgi:hypothetical protein